MLMLKGKSVVSGVASEGVWETMPYIELNSCPFPVKHVLQPT